MPETSRSCVLVSSVRLAADGRIPQPSLNGLPSQIMQSCVDGLAVIYSAARRIVILPPAASVPNTISEAQIVRAKTVWTLAHHAFCYNVGLLEYCYRNLLALPEGRPNAYRLWADRIQELWRGAGALMLFGCDFYPTSEIYRTNIRATMPEGFSGRWILEWKLLMCQMAQFEELVHKAASGEISRADAIIAQGRNVYEAYHQNVMRIAVPGELSLAQQYRKKYGCPHKLGAHEAETFDAYFSIERSDSLTLADYVKGVVEIFLLIENALRGGHQLSEVVLADLANSMRCTASILADGLAQQV
jgi:hypothetical protein